MGKSVEEAIHSYIEGVNIREQRDIQKVKASAILAGVLISIGAFASVNAGINLPLGLSKVVSGIIFSSALIMIVLLGLDLFTGNVLASFKYFRKFNINSICLLWFWVYVYNFVGCIVSVILLRLSGLAVAVQDKLDSIALMKCSLPFCDAFIRGIFCNLLVCTAILIAAEAKTVQGKIFGIMVPISVFIISGYEHSIANMFFIPMSNVTIFQFLHNIIPVTLGNIVGGLILVVFLRRSKNV